MTTDPEVTVICIDNSSWLGDGPIFEAQIDAIKFYCKTKIERNPENLVGIFVMGSVQFGIDCDFDAKSEFSETLTSTWDAFYDSPQDMKRRLLMFVGSPINMHGRLVKPIGELLKERRVALDVVNFFVLDVGPDPPRVMYDILYGIYHYARSELAELVTVVNDGGNGVIVDVDESSVIDKVSRFMLRMNQEERYAEDNVNVEQKLELHHIEKNEKGAKGKVGSYKERSAENNTNVEQEWELHHNEKNKKGAKGEVGSYVMHVCCLIAVFPLLICLCWADKQAII